MLDTENRTTFNGNGNRPENLELLDQIHQDALRVLEEVGVKCDSPELRQIFEDTGLAAFDETTGHLYVLTPLVEQALATAPKRDQYWIAENAFGVGGTAPFVLDDLTEELVQPTFEHPARIAQIVDAADVVNFMARGVLIPKKVRVSPDATCIRVFKRAHLIFRCQARQAHRTLPGNRTGPSTGM